MIHRYSRHLLLPDFGRKLSQPSILVVGAGGLGSPVALYLAACGVGYLGIVDGDDVVEHCHTLKPFNALEIVRKYDIVVDATDNLPTRYMISDCCVLLNKPLISGAALGLEGQVKIRGISSACMVCGENSVFTQEDFQKFDYENFTQSPMSDKEAYSLK
ncbi:hypothetical protein GUJ93_ZPchr0006g44315 [Zizania palustris]|uniref:THIF-type NAD/FAD binding fold domain-containing protein n=1 Tax=Zizania palustris TaxID=103762 RepID=A0A8J5SEY0_ZIZPA|nr:hypothetical protein GUJ93_ZPchr0006g44315 [Zizania palustris]